MTRVARPGRDRPGQDRPGQDRPGLDRPGVAEAYDTLAATYDDLVIEDSWMRRYLWRRYDRLFTAGQRVLELGCGTGLDTVYLASSGLRVLAVDVSPAMAARLRDKLRDHPARSQVKIRTMDLADLDSLHEASGDDAVRPPFDGVVSAFAGLNTVPDLEFLAGRLGRLLRPGSRGLLHLLAPAGLWRCARSLFRHGLAAARAERRLEMRRVTINGHPIEHRVLDLVATVDALAPHLRVVRAGSLGVLWPRTWGRRVADDFAGRRLAALDAAAGSLWPLRDWGRFLVLEVERP